MKGCAGSAGRALAGQARECGIRARHALRADWRKARAGAPPSSMGCRWFVVTDAIIAPTAPGEELFKASLSQPVELLEGSPGSLTPAITDTDHH